MRAGRLSKLVAIEAPTTSNVLGVATTTWAAVGGPVYAAIEPVSAREYQWAGQQHADVTHLAKLWFREGLTAAMRLNYRGRLFYFLEPPRDVGERHRELQVMVREDT